MMTKTLAAPSFPRERALSIEPEKRLRNSGIDLIGAIPWGTHFCQFYETPRDLIEVLTPYFQAGLEQNEFCLWVASEPLEIEDAKNALHRAIPDLEEYLRRGQIEFLDYGEWYAPSGKFDAGRVLAGWIEKAESAQKRGFDGLRLTGNTFWLEKRDWSDFTEYEATVDRVLRNYPIIALCSYALQRCNAIEIINVVNNHQFALIKQSGRWELMESRQRKRAEEELERQIEELTRFNRAMVGRELRMVELKQEINALCAEIGRPPRYSLAFMEPS